MSESISALEVENPKVVNLPVGVTLENTPEDQLSTEIAISDEAAEEIKRQNDKLDKTEYQIDGAENKCHNQATHLVRLLFDYISSKQKSPHNPEEKLPVFADEFQQKIDAICQTKKKNEYNTWLIVFWAIVGKPENPSKTTSTRHTRIANALKFAWLECWDKKELAQKLDQMGGLKGISDQCQKRYPTRSVKRSKVSISSSPIIAAVRPAAHLSAETTRPNDVILSTILSAEIATSYNDGEYYFEGSINAGVIYITRIEPRDSSGKYANPPKPENV